MRTSVVVAGGLMALGWLTLLAAYVAEGSGVVASVPEAVPGNALLVMIVVNVWWQLMLRRERRLADPEAFTAERTERRRARSRYRRGLLGWSWRTLAGRVKHDLTDDSGNLAKPEPHQPLMPLMLHGDPLRQRPRVGAPPGLAKEVRRSGRRWWSFLRGFVTPMRAALVEWRARP